jgi:hypothetical protein
MTPTRFLSHTEKLDLVLDVLRANELHQDACAALRVARKQRGSTLYFVPVACDCWLSEPPEPPALDGRDLRVDVDPHPTPWRPDLPKDQWPAVRVTHLPTGHTVTRRGRSQLQAKAEALHALAEQVAAAAVADPEEEP